MPKGWEGKRTVGEWNRLARADIERRSYKRYRSRGPYRPDPRPMIQWCHKEATTGAFNVAYDAGVKLLVNNLAHGTTEGTRTRNRIQMKSIEVRGVFYSNTAVAGCSVMVSLIYMRDNHGAALAIPDVYNSLKSSDCCRYPELRSSHIILAEKRLSLEPKGAGRDEIMFNIRKKMNHPVQYNDSNNNDITDIESGALYLYFTSSVGAAGDEPSCYHSYVLQYTDA